VKAQQNGTAQELYSSYRHIAQINNTVVFAVIRMRRIVAAMQFHLRRGTFLGSPAPAEVLAEARWDPQILHLDPGFLARLAESLNAEVRRRLTLSIVGAETAQEFEGLRRCLEQHSDMCVGVVDDALVWLHIALTQATMTDSVRASLLSIAAQHESANGDFKKAAAMLQKARQISPGDPYFLLREALLNGEQGRFAEAEAVLARLSGGQEHSRHDQRSIEATRAALARLRERASLAPGSSEPAKLPAR
jgi:tetratricopeptide (TPR) repeat protein